MTVGKAGRRPTATGCGSSISTKPSKPSGRTPVSTGCGTSSAGGWKPKANTGGKLSERAKKELEKTKKTSGRTSVSTGCGSSAPSKPSKPSKPSHTVRTGC